MNQPATTTIDPVCGMTVDPATAAGASTYDGATYHFCSRHCETRFNVAPQQYVVAAPVAACCSTSGHSCC